MMEVKYESAKSSVWRPRYDLKSARSASERGREWEWARYCRLRGARACPWRRPGVWGGLAGRGGWESDLAAVAMAVAGRGDWRSGGRGDVVGRRGRSRGAARREADEAVGAHASCCAGGKGPAVASGRSEHRRGSTVTWSAAVSSAFWLPRPSTPTTATTAACFDCPDCPDCSGSAAPPTLYSPSLQAVPVTPSGSPCRRCQSPPAISPRSTTATLNHRRRSTTALPAHHRRVMRAGAAAISTSTL